MYSCEFPCFVQHRKFLTGLDRFDTLEHCLTCVSFVFYMILSWNLYLPIELLFSVRLRSILFFAVLTIGEVLFTPRSNLVSLELGRRLHLLRHDRRTVLFTPQVTLLLNLIMPVWLSSCKWYSSCHLPNNKVIGQFLTVFEDWVGFIIWWTVQGTVIIPLSTAC